MKRPRFMKGVLAPILIAICPAFPALAGDVENGGDQNSARESAYLAENHAAMNKMMASMDVKPTGDVDRDFVEMMTPHHQGAIDMAIAVLKYGKNERLKRIAQEIIIDQQQEIAAMKLAIGDKLPPSAPAPTLVSPEKSASGTVCAMDPKMKM